MSRQDAIIQRLSLMLAFSVVGVDPAMSDEPAKPEGPSVFLLNALGNYLVSRDAAPAIARIIIDDQLSIQHLGLKYDFVLTDEGAVWRLVGGPGKQFPKSLMKNAYEEAFSYEYLVRIRKSDGAILDFMMTRLGFPVLDVPPRE